MKKVMVCLFLFLFTGPVLANENSISRGERYLVKVEFKSPEDLRIIITSNFNSYSKGESFVIGEAELSTLKGLKSEGLTYSVLDRNPQLHDYYFVWYRGKEPLTKAAEWIKSKGRALYQEDKMFLVEGSPEKMEELPGYQMSLQKLSHKPLVLELPSPEEVYKATAHSPVIASMISKVKTEDLLGLVKDLSGSGLF